MMRLKDVAARAGVSLMTVSKVLRDAPDVSQTTKAKVRQLADEMGYVPDALARGLRTRRTQLFGLVVPSVTHPVLSQMVLAIEHRVYELGYDLLLAQTQDNPRREEACLHRLLARRVDGLFVAPVYRLAPAAPIYEELMRSGTPTVLLGHGAPFCSAFPSVESDDALASYELCQNLIRLGHEQIAFFAGPPAAPWAQEHFDGYRRALREANLPLDERLVFSAGASIEDGRKAAAQMLSESAPATAIQTASDLVALGVATVLWKQGLRIPEDVSLSGYGNHLAAEHMRVPLTTVRLPNYALGVAATEAMQRLLRGDVAETKRLPGEVIPRKSTAPPARNGKFVAESSGQSRHMLAQGDELQ
jgi:LacI family transcriptional regulator, galactose operon repressor